MASSMARRSRACARSVLSLLLAAGLPATVMAAESTAAPAAEKPSPTSQPLRCDPPSLAWDRMTVLCRIEPTAVRRMRVRIHLTGSHDDTNASLEVAVGDAPVACDAGSKTSTEGEDGDVVLDCRFSALAKPGAATVRASARWFHAQYVGFEADAREP
jgi:hypothetical protein